MCFKCDWTYELAATTQALGAWHDSIALFELSAAKATTAFIPDGVGGDLRVPDFAALAVLTADDVGDSPATASTLTVGAPAIVSTIDMIGDQDFYRVELIAGHTYDFGQYAKLGGPSLVPLSDAYLELYDSSGELIVSADGGGPNTPSGLDALLTYTAEYSGVYFINARAFDNIPEDGDKGDLVGDYELFANDVTGRPSYQPYYSPDSPLHSIDWGSQVDRTSRNPDGAEGPRVTGNPFTGVGGNPFGIEGKNVITVYFAKTGDVFLSEDPTNPGLTTTIVAKGLQAWEKEAFEAALDVYEQAADLVFVEVQNRAEADFKIITYNGTPGVGASLLGRMSPPGELNEGQAEFNSGDVRWTEEGLQPGGFYFPTLIHEFGHGLGMAHPHDNGGRSSIMRGAGGGTGGIGGGLGDFNLSQQVHTVMSYNDGWATSPYGQPRSGGITGTEVDHFGWVASLSPLDIAVIQDKYGVNEEWATGDDVYAIKDFNGPGNFFSSIWDAGGVDSIVYSGEADASIDLRPATLQYEEGGGGRVSYAWGIHGGYTIANGVTIENASGGAGDDRLTGNGAANALDGGAGDDLVEGGAGGDTLRGGAGIDTLSYEGSAKGVRVELTKGTVLDNGATDLIFDFENVTGSAHADKLYGTNGVNALAGLSGNDVLNGHGGADLLDGGAGADQLFGGHGADRMTGGGGADRFYFDSGFRSGTDTIADFASGVDDLYLLASAFGTTRGAAANLIVDGAAAGASCFLFDSASGLLSFDADGAGAGAAVAVCNLGSGVSLASADMVFY